MRTRSFLLASIVLSAPVATLLASGGPPVAPERLSHAADDYVCPPCGAACHQLSSDSPGACGECGMQLVLRSSVPHVGVLLYEGVDVLTSTGPLAAFASSSGSFVFTVADTTDPIRAQDSLSILPQYDFESVPQLDVLIVPSGSGHLYEDDYVLEWIQATAADARFVIGVGQGSLALIQAGLVEAGTPIPVPPFLAGRRSEEFPDNELVANEAIVYTGKAVLARDAAAAMEASLRVIEELNDRSKSDRSRTRLGYPRSE